MYTYGHLEAQALRLSWSFLLRFQILFGRTPYCTHLSYPLMLWTCWIMFLPWFLGRVINDVLGMVSVWGIVYEGQLHMSHEIYAAGFWDIVSFLVSLHVITMNSSFSCNSVTFILTLIHSCDVILHTLSRDKKLRLK